MSGRSKLCSFRVELSTPPRVGEPFQLAVTFTDLRGRAHDAFHEGALEAEVSIAYFRDHAVVHRSTHPLDAEGTLTTPVTLQRAGKHHVTFTLATAGRRLDRMTFDIHTTDRGP